MGYLFFGLRLLYIISSNFDSGGQDRSSELHYIHPKKVAELLCRWKDINTTGKSK